MGMRLHGYGRKALHRTEQMHCCLVRWLLAVTAAVLVPAAAVVMLLALVVLPAAPLPLPFVLRNDTILVLEMISPSKLVHAFSTVAI